MIENNIWHTLPPETQVYYGTFSDWCQTLMPHINMMMFESIEPSMYGVEVANYTETDVDKTPASIFYHPDRKNIVNSLFYYEEANKLLTTQRGNIRMIMSHSIKKDVLVFKNGIYENEIILIDEPYGK